MDVYVLRYDDYDMTDIIGIFEAVELAKENNRPPVKGLWQENDDETVWETETYPGSPDSVRVVIEQFKVITRVKGA